MAHRLPLTPASRLLALVVALCASAMSLSAGTITIKSVTCNEPELVSLYQRVLSGGEYVSTYVNLAGEPGDPTWELSSTSTYVNFMLQPAEGYKVNYTFADADGNVVRPLMGAGSGTVENASKTFSYNSNTVPEMYITLEVSEIEPDSELLVTVNGRGERVVLNFNGRRVVTGLHAGDNVVKFSSASENHLYLSCDPNPADDFTNDGYFSLVTLNGTAKNAIKNEIEDGGSVGDEEEREKRDTWNYSFDVKNQDCLVINTEFEGDACRIVVETNSGNDAFIEGVEVNGEPLAEWAGGFDVMPGDFVFVRGADYDYDLRSSYINGTATTPALSSVGRFIVEDTEFYFSVTKIARAYSITVSTDPTSRWRVTTATDKSCILPEGYSKLGFNTRESPLRFTPVQAPVDTPENAAPYLFKNETASFDFSEEDGCFSVSVADNDLVKAIFATEKPQTYKVTYMLEEGATVPTVMRDGYYPVTDFATGHTSLAGTLVEVFLPQEGTLSQNTFKVTLNGTPVDPVEDGYFAFPVTATTVVGFAGRHDMSDIDTLDCLTASPATGSDSWYTLQGVRLAGEPSAAGLYIRGGRKVVVTGK